MPKNIEEFMDCFEVTENGSLVFNGRRYVFTTGLLVALSLFAIPKERYGNSFRPFLRRALVSYGRKRALREEEYGVKGALERYLAENYLTGFGRTELVEFSDSRVVVRVYGSLYGEEAGRYIRDRGMKPEPVCVMGYVVEGILNYFAEKEGKPLFLSREVKCKAMGDEYCEFLLERGA